MKAAKSSEKPPGARQRAQQIHVPIRPDEAEAIKKNAANCGLPMAAYLHHLSKGLREEGIQLRTGQLE